MGPEDFTPYLNLLLDFFAPVLRTAEDPLQAEVLLAELGYAPPSQLAAFGEFSAGAGALLNLVDVMQQAVEDDQDLSSLLPKLAEAVIEVGRFFQSINNIAAKIQANFAGSDFLTQTDILTAIPRKLADYLVINYLEIHHNILHAALLVAGVLDIEDIDETPTPFYVPYRKRTVHWEKLPAFFKDPVGTLKANFIEPNDFLYDRLVFLLDQLCVAAGIYTTYTLPDDNALTAFNKGADLTALDKYESLYSLHIPLLNDLTAGPTLEIYPTLDAATGEYTGLGMSLRLGGQMEVPISESYRLVIKLHASLEDSLGLAVDRNGNFTFINKLLTPNPETLAAGAQFGVRISVEPTENGPADSLVSLGGPAGTHFKIGSGSLSFGIEKLDALNLSVEGDLKDGELSFKAEQADGFIARLLPAEGISGTFSLGIGVSSRAGLYFKGTSSLYIRLPLHQSLGPVDIEYLGLGFGFENDRFPLTLTTGFSALLGPLTAVVEDIGVRAVFKIKPDRSGNLGPMDVVFAFNPPKGVGLAIDAGAVKGGGYLYFDFDRGEYAGALELTVSDWLALKAIGLINTKLPGGQSGFSLLVILTAEFNPGFQLGYGFTLIGVGGILGLNRAMLLDPLVQGVRTGAVNSILFPTNIVANAPKILSDLRTIFPPQPDVFLIGPMAKIGWGTPTLISVSLGVIIEIPGNVVILGRLRAALPTEDAAVLVLQVTFIGALEFDKRRIWFFATMYESRVLFITLDGDMGLLMDFSDNPNFVLSVGGFHPRFSAPPLPFPSPSRIALSLVNESWARVRAEAYFAVTSNSVQMGCRLEAFFGFDALKVEGHFGFDALVRFSPFYLIVEVSAGFSVKVFGIGLFSVHLRGSLEGPTPWHISGSAEISILFFSIDVDVDVTFGERRAEVLPPIEVLPRIRAEFEKLESWRATLPSSGRFLVSLRELGNAEALVLHPVGTLRISQRFAPLNLPLDKIGNQKPSDVKKVTVGVQTGALAVRGPTREKFAVAQYRQMDDAAKLSAQAYEPLESGIEAGAAAQPWATGPAAQRNVRYEMIVVDTAFQRSRVLFFKFWDGLFAHFRAGASVSRAAVSLANEKRMQPFDAKVAVVEDLYTVAFQANNHACAAEATFGSYAEAQAHMDEAVRLNPSLAEEVHVIPTVEVNQAP